MLHLNRIECGETGESWKPRNQRNALTCRVCVWRQRERNTAANFAKKPDLTKQKSLAVAAIPLAPNSAASKSALYSLAYNQSDPTDQRLRFNAVRTNYLKGIYFAEEQWRSEIR